MRTKFWLDNLKGRNLSEDKDVDERIKNKSKGNHVWGVEWNGWECVMDRDRDRWWAFLNAVMNFRVP
jgi:hypothetical protein